MNIDILILILFLVINLIIGLFFSRGIKDLKEYALGGRNFSTGTLAATMIATWLGGSSFFMTVSETYSEGLYFIIPGLGDGASFFIIAYLIAPRITEFLGKLSVADVMGSLYNKNIRMITAILAIMPALGNIAIQFSVLATLLNYLLGISSIYSVLISGIVVITYSTFGGIKAVTFTDMIQFFTFGVVIPMVVFLIWKTLSGTNDIIYNLVQNDSFNYRKFFSYDNPNLFSTISLTLFFVIPGLDPAVFQRISMCKNRDQICRSFKTAGLFVIAIDLVLTTIIGILLLSNNPDLDSDNLIPYIMDNYMHSGIKGLFVIGIMAMLMSTADSYINSSAVLIAYDICKTGGIKLSRKKELLLVRVSALLLGVFALIVSVFSKRLFDIVTSTYGFYMPVVTVPLLLAIFGFRSTSKAVLTGMSAGFFTVILLNLLSNIDSLMPGMLANLVFFMGSHYLLKQKGGWVGIKEPKPLNDIRLERKRKIYGFINFIKNFNFITFCKTNNPQDKNFYVYFGLFLSISTISHIFSLPRNLYEENTILLNVLYYSLLIISVIFITYPIWLQNYKKDTILSIIWILTMLYFTCSNTILIIMSNFNHLQFTILMSGLIAIAVLLRWQVVTFIIIVGALCSMQFYELYIDTDVIVNYNTLQFKLVYSLLLFSSILIALFKPKQQYLEATEERAEHLKHEVKILEKEVGHAKRELENVVQGLDFLENQFKDKEGKLKAKEIYLKDQLKLRNIEIAKLKDLKNEFIRNIPHEANTPLTGILSLSDVLYSCYDSLDRKTLKQSIKYIVNSSDRLKSYVSNIADLSKLSALTYELNREEVDLSELVRERPVLYKKIFTDDAKQEFIFKVEDKLMVQCDEYYITQAIDNLISNAVKYGEGKPITISLTKTVNNKVKFTISDEGIGIPKDELISIFHKFTTSSKTRTPAGGRGVGLALCEKVITVHGGTIEAQSDGKKGSEFGFVLPI